MTALRMMTCEQFAEVLGDVLEREADERTLAAAEAHASRCAGCGELLADLERIRLEAARLPVLSPARDLWADIGKRIEAPVVPLPVASAGSRTTSGYISRRVAMAAAAGLVIVTAGVTYTLARQGSPAVAAPPLVAQVAQVAATDSIPVIDSSAATADRASEARRVAVSSSAPAPAAEPRDASARPARSAPPLAAVPMIAVSASEVYDAEIAKLRAIVDAQRSNLDTATIGVIDRNLQVIDAAIEQVRGALARDPASRFLMESLSNAYQRKVELLRSAASLEGGGGDLQ